MSRPQDSRTFCHEENILYLGLSDLRAICHLWLLSTSNVVTATEELKFYISLNLTGPVWLLLDCVVWNSEGIFLGLLFTDMY